MGPRVDSCNSAGGCSIDFGNGAMRTQMVYSNRIDQMMRTQEI